MDCLAVLDPEECEIVWVSRGRWQRQPEARVTPSGYVLLFDNRTFDGQSRIVKYDVPNDAIVWSYAADGFYSLGAGAQHSFRTATFSSRSRRRGGSSRSPSTGVSSGST